MPYKDKNDPRYKAARLRHYYKNKQQYLERNKITKKRIAKMIDKIKEAPCTDCGVQYPPHVMQFDHISNDKLHNVAKLRRDGRLSLALAEIKKCELVCANCHAERTHSRAISVVVTH